MIAARCMAALLTAKLKTISVGILFSMAANLDQNY